MNFKLVVLLLIAVVSSSMGCSDFTPLISGVDLTPENVWAGEWSLVDTEGVGATDLLIESIEEFQDDNIFFYPSGESVPAPDSVKNAVLADYLSGVGNVLSEHGEIIFMFYEDGSMLVQAELYVELEEGSLYFYDAHEGLYSVLDTSYSMVVDDEEEVGEWELTDDLLTLHSQEGEYILTLVKIGGFAEPTKPPAIRIHVDGDIVVTLDLLGFSD